MMNGPAAPAKITYLNTDLDLVAPRPLNTLTSALEARGLFVLGEDAGCRGDDGQWYVILEQLDGVEWPGHPEATILLMLAAIESIDGDAKVLWSACSVREFNIGYNCGDEPWAYNDGLANSTLTRIAAIGASLRITLYPQRVPESAPGGTAER